MKLTTKKIKSMIARDMKFVESVHATEILSKSKWTHINNLCSEIRGS
jgi:hypothetical protein